jgi:transcriptional regulator with XRE-family HTH domain
MGIRGIFARNLRQVRHEKGYSQEALVLEAGVDRTYISPLEHCVYSASIDMVAKLPAVLGVETDTLLHRFAAKAGRKKPLPPGAEHC